jgi:Protein of unknown function (DUF3015)
MEGMVLALGFLRSFALHKCNRSAAFSTLKGSLMKKLLCIASLVIAAPAAMAQANNVGSCGWGSKVFEGQKGVAPQVLAATTNGTSGNQTFGITFGTSGCTQDGVVSSTWKTAMFIDGNKLALARDAAAGQGESMDALAVLMGVQVADKAYFNATVKSQFATVFATDAVAANLKAVMLADARLAGYAAAI